MHNKKMALVDTLVSTGKNYCEGYYATSHSGYFLGVNLGAAATKKQFSHEGSSNLDKINAFDLAEISNANISQINMIQVSSFCGPKGAIWGYDVCCVPKQTTPYDIHTNDLGDLAYRGQDLRIWDIDPLVDAFTRLTGTVRKPRFPFMPGAHVPCAVKTITAAGAKVLYAAQAIGIPDDRSRHACLIMEDFGTIPQHEKPIRDILIGLVRSILTIGQNQHVNYREVFVGIKTIKVEDDEMGCALVANPYFVLAQHAFPHSHRSIAELNLTEWEYEVERDFLLSGEFY